MPSATSRDFYASGLGIPADGYSLDDLKYKYYNNVSRLPVNSGSLADNMIDFLLFKLSLPYGTNYSLDDLLSLYYATLGIQTEEQYENGVLKTRTNLHNNPNVGAAGTNGFTANYGTGGAGSMTHETSGGFNGPDFIRMLWSAPSSDINRGLQTSIATTVLPSFGHYTLSSYVRVNNLPQRMFQPFTGPGAAVPVGAYPQFDVAIDTWTRINSTLDYTALPAGLELRSYANGGGAGRVWSIGDTLDVDCFLVEAGDNLLPYFDGNFPGARWLGAVNNSQSQLTTWSA